ncbi:hypothetical protein BHE97_11510 [Aeromicrobium sp. PE09-221]|uniref:GOLPH3/VPS74 family protein n=1 Tax=Aeromicrobium sp. PE09-221 TaxID=1898043 RepID=UPI000B3EA80C|nr:GPP34 family phosphoprotein [Aeromicrobium sp. PE09-221]OUZ09122.1 hypothetical protein BHE97_11510 [Aeromicrobium sp. PE09-221]
MSIATDLVLMATDPITHKLTLSSVNNDAIIGGAHLLDLVAARRVAVEGTAKKVRVRVIDGSPYPDPEVDEALSRLRDGKTRKASDAVTRLGKNGVQNAYRRLVGTGQVRDRQESVLGFGLRRHEVLDIARRDDLIARVRDALLQGLPVDATSGPLIGLLQASDQLKLVTSRDERKTAKTAAAAISAEDWASAGVKDAIAATQTALAVAVFTPTVIAATSS